MLLLATEMVRLLELGQLLQLLRALLQHQSQAQLRSIRSDARLLCYVLSCDVIVRCNIIVLLMVYYNDLTVISII